MFSARFWTPRMFDARHWSATGAVSTEFDVDGALRWVRRYHVRLVKRTGLRIRRLS